MPVPEAEINRMWKKSVALNNRDAAINETARDEILRLDLSPKQREAKVGFIGESLNTLNNHGNKEEAARIAFKTAQRELENSWNNPELNRTRTMALSAVAEHIAGNHPDAPVTKFLRNQNISALSEGERDLVGRSIAKEVRQTNKPEEFLKHLEEHGGDFRALGWDGMNHTTESAARAMKHLGEGLESQGFNEAAVGQVLERMVVVHGERAKSEPEHPISAFAKAIEKSYQQPERIARNRPKETAELLKRIASATPEQRKSTNWGKLFTGLLKGR